MKKGKSWFGLFVVMLVVGLCSQTFAAPAPLDAVGISSSYNGGYLEVRNSDVSSILTSSYITGMSQVEFNRSGDLVLGTSYSGGYIYVCDGIDTTTLKGDYATGGTPTSLQVHSSGTIAYAVGSTVTTLSADGSTLLSTVNLAETVSDIAFRADGNLVVGTSGRVFVLSGSDLTDTLAESDGTIGQITALGVKSDNSIVVGSMSFNGGGLYTMKADLSTVYEREMVVAARVNDIAIQSNDNIVTGSAYNGGSLALISPDLIDLLSFNPNVGSDVLFVEVQSNDDVVIAAAYADGQIITYGANDMNAFKAIKYTEGTNDLGVMVPEPATMLLLGFGGAVAMLRRRRK